ncbi:MAG: sugar phosphate isomerase/epimerase [Planctomycetota bacterium]|nr:sugar phosphate isomerase/epimerase [Planctomycetota bacterium]
MADERGGEGKGMKLAVTAAPDAGPMAPILLRGEFAGIVSEAAGIGYDAIEIHVPDIWEFDADNLFHLCKAAGIAVSALVSGQLFVRKGLSLSDDDPAIAAKAAEGLELFVDAAAKLECGVIVGWVRGRIGSRDREAIMAKQAAALREIDARGRERNVPIYLEAINRYEADSLTTAGETVDFIRKNGFASTYVHLDTFHMNIEEFSPAKAIRQCGPLLAYMHVAENTRYYPGHDRLDFGEVFAALREIGYNGFVSVECLPLPGGSEAARRAREFLTCRHVC